eukprot:gene14039-biopygen9134
MPLAAKCRHFGHWRHGGKVAELGGKAMAWRHGGKVAAWRQGGGKAPRDSLAAKSRQSLRQNGLSCQRNAMHG